MSNQIIITSGAKVRSLEGVLTGTSGVVSSVPLGAANGVATLDSGGKVPVSQLPSSVVTYLGTWNAATNTPTLVNGVGDAGDMYICNVAGTVNFGAGPVTFAVGDWVLYGSGTWQKSNGQNGTVTSVGASITGNAIGLTGSPITTAGTLAFAFSGTSGQYVNGAGNLTTFPTLITSIGLSMPSAFSVANSPLTANGSINVTGAGTSAQYIDGTGALQTFPALTGYVPYTGATADVDLGTHVLNAQALHVKGTAGAGHLGLKHQTATPTGSANESLIFADVNGNLGWQNDNLYLTTLVSNANTANRSYTFPNASGTLALTSDISYPVTSVFGRTGAVTAQSGDYTTTLVTEGTRLYYTDARARAALSFTAGSGAYNSTTGVITIPTNTSQLTNGANFITLASLSAGTGISYNNLTGVITSTITQYTDAMARAAISGGTGISYNSTTGVITNTITQYTDAQARAAISLTTTGTSGAATYNSTTGVLNIPQYTDAYTGTVTSVAMTVPTGLSVSGSPITTSGTLAVTLTAGYSIPTTASQTNWDTAYTNRITSATSPLSITSNVISISQATTSTSGYLSSTDWNTFNSKQGTITLTTTGTSGAATLVSNTLNIPNYTLSGLGGIGGSGTANYLPKFTAGTTIGNSIISESGTTISIAGNMVISGGNNLRVLTTTNATTGYQYADFLNTTGRIVWGINGSAANGLATNSLAYGGIIYSNNSLQLGVDGDMKMTLNSSGNLGLGVTPSAWGGNARVFEGANGSALSSNVAAPETALMSNAFYNGSSWIYKTSSQAARYSVNGYNGSHTWEVAPSGTTGNAISFTQAMTLTASGNLGVGIATPTERLHIYSSASSTEIRIENSTTSAYIRSQTDNLNFYFNGADRMRIFSNGNIGVGTTTDSGYKLDVNGTGRFSGTINSTVGNNGALLSANTATTGYQYIDIINTSGRTQLIQESSVAGTTVNNSTAYSSMFGSAVDKDVILFTNGTKRLLIDGTTGAATFSSTTGASLTSVSSDFYASLTLQHTGGSNAGQWNIQSVSGTQIGASAGAAFGIYSNTASAYRFYINPSGNVGIGTISPSYKTEVSGSIGNYWNGSAFTGTPLALAITNTTAGGYDPVLMLQQTDSGGTSKNAGAIGMVGTGPWTAGSNSSQTSDMYFLVRNGSGSISERMRIKSDGSVGIGTTSPDRLFTIAPASGDAYINLKRPVAASTQATLEFNTAGTNDWLIRTDDASANLKFYSYGISSYALILARSTGAATFSSTIKTAGFGSTTARPWKLGELVTATVIGVNTTGYLTVEVNGSQYNLALANLA